MARASQDREDLLRDATAFVTRVQLKVAQNDHSLSTFVGFRSQGAVSFYFDQDPVYHFNDNGELRRAFVDDQLLKAENGQLVSLNRNNHDEEVVMLRQNLSHEQQKSFCQTARQQLDHLRQTLLAGDFIIEGQVDPSAEGGVIDRITASIQQLDGIRIAATPNVAG